MTATLSARQCDNAAAALCIVRAQERGDMEGWQAVCNSIDPADLVQGFVILASGFRAAWAQAAGASTEAIDALTFIHYQRSTP